AGVVDYDGQWNGQGLAAAASRLAGPRAEEIAPEELRQLDLRLEKLRDLLFELFFLEDGVALADPKGKASWFGKKKLSDEEAAAAAALAIERRAEALRPYEAQIDFYHGLDAAVASAQLVLAAFREGKPPSS
ncbi:unnamed protein product, partial [Polarella glacialis]